MNQSSKGGCSYHIKNAPRNVSSHRFDCFLINQLHQAVTLKNLTLYGAWLFETWLFIARQRGFPCTVQKARQRGLPCTVQKGLSAVEQHRLQEGLRIISIYWKQSAYWKQHAYKIISRDATALQQGEHLGPSGFRWAYFYIRVNVKALVTGSITKRPPNSTKEPRIFCREKSLVSFPPTWNRP